MTPRTPIVDCWAVPDFTITAYDKHMTMIERVLWNGVIGPERPARHRTCVSMPGDDGWNVVVQQTLIGMKDGEGGLLITLRRRASSILKIEDLTIDRRGESLRDLSIDGLRRLLSPITEAWQNAIIRTFELDDAVESAAACLNACVDEVGIQEAVAGGSTSRYVAIGLDPRQPPTVSISAEKFRTSGINRQLPCEDPAMSASLTRHLDQSLRGAMFDTGPSGGHLRIRKGSTEARLAPPADPLAVLRSLA